MKTLILYGSPRTKKAKPTRSIQRLVWVGSVRVKLVLEDNKQVSIYRQSEFDRRRWDWEATL